MGGVIGLIPEEAELLFALEEGAAGGHALLSPDESPAVIQGDVPAFISILLPAGWLTEMVVLEEAAEAGPEGDPLAGDPPGVDAGVDPPPGAGVGPVLGAGEPPDGVGPARKLIEVAASEELRNQSLFTAGWETSVHSIWSTDARNVFQSLHAGVVAAETRTRPGVDPIF